MLRKNYIKLRLTNAWKKWALSGAFAKIKVASRKYFHFAKVYKTFSFVSSISVRNGFKAHLLQAPTVRCNPF